jgi:hypothetical protein
MPDRRWRRAVAALLACQALFVAAPLSAQADTALPQDRPATAEAQRAATTLLPLLQGGNAFADAFSVNFLNSVPPEQVAALFAQMRNQHGMPGRIVSLTPTPGGDRFDLVVGYAHANVHFHLYVDGAARITGLRVSNITTANDSWVRLASDIDRLPGVVAWGLYRIEEDGRPALITGERNHLDMAVGSSFKLVILATLDDQIRRHRMRWDDVVRIDRRSVSTSEIVSWPMGSPLTLHTLAALMISQSDNSATDILLHHIGRERIEAFARNNGGLSGPNAFPMLSTIEATSLKNPALGDVRMRWLTGDAEQRRELLEQEQAQFIPANVDFSVFNDGPADIDSIEWFASPDSLARLLGWFTTRGSDEARAILAINPGIPADAAARWPYLGYKGGSEPGVMAMNLLMRDAQGRAYVAAMAWNNDQAPVDEAAMVTLISRASALLHER